MDNAVFTYSESLKGTGHRRPLNSQNTTAAKQTENNSTARQHDSTAREHDVTAIAQDSTAIAHDKQITLSQSVENHSHISVLYMNARSLLPKRDEILAYVAMKKPDVIAITETWIRPDYLMSEFSITGYESFHKKWVHKRGGDIYYSKNTLSAAKLEKQDADNYDSVYVDITTKRNRKLIFGTVYGPPKLQAADDTALYEEINTIIQNKFSVTIGVIHYPNVDWNVMYGDQEGNRLVEMAEDAFLTQILNQPIRENNILDLALVTDPDLIRSFKFGEK